MTQLTYESCDTTNFNTTTEVVDIDAVKIGERYLKLRNHTVDLIRGWHALGEMLAAKKNDLGHGNWTPWVEANDEVLGFGELTAQRIMRFSKASLATLLENPTDALAKLWGHKPMPKQIKPPAEPEEVMDEDYVTGEAETSAEARKAAWAEREDAKIVASNQKEFFIMNCHAAAQIAQQSHDLKVDDEILAACLLAAEAWAALATQMGGDDVVT